MPRQPCCILFCGMDFPSVLPVHTDTSSPPTLPTISKKSFAMLWAQEGEDDEDTDDHFGSAIQLDLSHISEQEDTAAAIKDTANNAGVADAVEPDAAAAATESDDGEMHSAEEAPQGAHKFLAFCTDMHMQALMASAWHRPRQCDAPAD